MHQGFNYQIFSLSVEDENRDKAKDTPFLDKILVTPCPEIFISSVNFSFHSQRVTLIFST